MNKAETYSSKIIDEILEQITPEEAERTRKRMLLAVRIEEGIKNRGWKQKDLAKALNKLPSEISKWLSGTHNFSTDTLFDIESALNINLLHIDEKHEQQVIKFHVVVSDYVKTFKSSSYPGFNKENSLIDLYCDEKLMNSEELSKGFKC